MRPEDFINKVMSAFDEILEGALNLALEGPEPPPNPNTVGWTRREWKGHKYLLHTVKYGEGYETLLLSRMYTSPNFPEALKQMLKTTPIVTIERYSNEYEALTGHQAWADRMAKSGPPQHLIDLSETTDTQKLDAELGRQWRLQQLAVA